MKKICCVILCLSFLFTLVGCGKLRTSSPEEVSFYYRRTEFQYNTDENIIVPESRTVSAHYEDFNYVLSLYLMGPLDDSLMSPFHDGTRLFSVTNDDSSVSIILSSQDNHLTDSSFALACACISLTCMDLSGAEAVTVTSGRRSITMTKDSLMLTDSVLQQELPAKE
jgi:spore germination protein GerM